MKLYLSLLLAPLVLAGHWSACVFPNGGGRERASTQVCCSLQEDGIVYSEQYNDCRAKKGLTTKNNSVDSGKFASCCANDGFGSVGE